MASLENQVIGGVVALLFGLFSWMFKKTEKKAHDADRKANECLTKNDHFETRLASVESELKALRNIEVDQAVIKSEITHVKHAIDSIARHIEKSNKSNE
ncbi:MAG: hypothetical protein MI685_08105 [Chlorobiales bacterium]|nr:hypothetical protein [Chlorobiales bacterium]